jgi:exodeoxyribonuclease VII large subunit
MDEKTNALSVHEAVSLAARHVEAIPTLVVTGEVSGFRSPNARSGHCYFQLKDEQSSMDAIVWRGIYQSCGFKLKDGLMVQITGSFNIYKPSGKLSFVAKKIEVAGEGLLRQQVAELARKLQAEGLMDDARKRRPPRFCERVAVVTSLSGSVIDDVKRTLARRNPLVELQMVGCKVQGEGAPETIMRALSVAAQASPDAILLVRGGGSYEDLMTFNDEALARAVAASPVPVITGIGHEPDTSICDMVADRRCSTPTAAAESVAPAIDELETRCSERASRLARSMSQMSSMHGERVSNLAMRSERAVLSGLAKQRDRVDALASRRCLTSPWAIVEDRVAQLDQTEDRMHAAVPRMLARQGREMAYAAQRLEAVGGRLLAPYESSIERASGALDALSPLKVLARGYAIARDGEGHVIGSSDKVDVGEEIEVLLGRGSISATVSGVRE